MTDYDVIIVGGGPAGLSGALILGRCRRRVLLCDAGQPRNGASQSLNGFLTRDGISPLQLRQIAGEQLKKYDTIEVHNANVTDAIEVDEGFQVSLAGGTVAKCRKLLLATGVVDRIPQLEGIEAFYGRSVFHCPYCDGWEMRDQPIGVYGKGEAGYGLALELTAWSRDLVLLTDGHAELTQNQLDRLTRNGIRICQRNIASLEGERGVLEKIRFEDGTTLDRRALFLASGEWQGSDLAAKLGCTFTPKGAVNTGTYETTNIRGLYVAGDASRYVQLSIVAAAEGAEAAFAINTALLREDLA